MANKKINIISIDESNDNGIIKNNSISYVCLIYKSVEWLKFTYEQFTKYTDLKENDEFFFVANDATQEVLDYLASSGIKYYIHNNTPEQREQWYINNVYRAWNKTITMAKGEYIVFLNSDFAYSKNWNINLFKNINDNKCISSRLIERGVLSTCPGAHGIERNFGNDPSDYDECAFCEYAETISEDKLEPKGLYMPLAIKRGKMIEVGMYPEGNILPNSDMYNPVYATKKDVYEDKKGCIPGDQVLMNKLGNIGIKHFTQFDSIVYHFQEGEQRDKNDDCKLHFYAYTTDSNTDMPITNTLKLVCFDIHKIGTDHFNIIGPSTKDKQNIVTQSTENDEKCQIFAYINTNIDHNNYDPNNLGQIPNYEIIYWYKTKITDCDFCEFSRLSPEKFTKLGKQSKRKTYDGYFYVPKYEYLLTLIKKRKIAPLYIHSELDNILIRSQYVKISQKCDGREKFLLKLYPQNSGLNKYDNYYSIILPYYNRRNLLINTLNSYNKFYRNRTDLEIIIVNDGSTEQDNIKDMIDMYPNLNIKIIELPPKTSSKQVNPCYPYNVGVKQSRGNVLILSSPETFHTHNIFELTNNFDKLCNKSYLLFSVFCCTDKDTLDEIARDNYELKPKNLIKFYDRLGEGLIPNSVNPRPLYNNNYGSWYLHSVIKPSHLNFLTALKRENYYKISGFNEIYRNGTGYDDNDFLDRLISDTDIKDFIYYDSMCAIHVDHEIVHNLLPTTNLNVYQSHAQYGKNDSWGLAPEFKIHKRPKIYDCFMLWN